MRERRKTYDAELRAARAEGRVEGAATAPGHGRRDERAGYGRTDVNRDGVADVRPKRRWFDAPGEG